MKPALADESMVTSPVSTPVLPGPAVVSEAVVLGIVVPGVVDDDVEVDVSCMLVLDSSAAPPSESSTRGPHADIVVAIPSTIAIVGADVSRCAAPQNGHRE